MSKVLKVYKAQDVVKVLTGDIRCIFCSSFLPKLGDFRPRAITQKVLFALLYSGNILYTSGRKWAGWAGSFLIPPTEQCYYTHLGFWVFVLCCKYCAIINFYVSEIITRWWWYTLHFLYSGNMIYITSVQNTFCLNYFLKSRAVQSARLSAFWSEAELQFEDLSLPNKPLSHI